MKKRLLITSIVMMLVVAVALSTATYAWFTSNSQVTASSVTMTAAVNDAAAIGIAWVGSSASKNPIVAADSGNLKPLVPATFTTGASGTLNTAMGYAASTVYTDNNGSTYKFNAAGATENAYYVWNDGGNLSATPDPIPAVEKFYIHNLSATTTVNITISVDIMDYIADATVVAVTGDTVLAAGTEYYKKNGENSYTLLVAGAEGDYTAGTTTAADLTEIDVYTIDPNKDVSSLVRVGVFTSDTVDGEYHLSNVFSEAGGQNVSSGTIAKDALTSTVKDQQTSVAENTATSLKTGLAGAQDVYIIVHVWLDGDGFVDALGGGKAKVALTFDAAQPAA